LSRTTTRWLLFGLLPVHTQPVVAIQAVGEVLAALLQLAAFASVYRLDEDGMAPAGRAVHLVCRRLQP
jgi:hypothetical protein